MTFYPNDEQPAEDNNFFQDAAGGFDSGKAFDWGKHMKGLPLEELLASHRKNMDAIRQSQQTAAELVRDLVQLNSQHMRHTFDDLSHYSRNAFVNAASSKEPAQANLLMDTLRASFDRSVAHSKQITDMFSQSTSKVFNAYRQRFDDGMKEAQKMTGNQAFTGSPS